jgi:hypothetical protein
LFLNTSNVYIKNIKIDNIVYSLLESTCYKRDVCFEEYLIFIQKSRIIALYELTFILIELYTCYEQIIFAWFLSIYVQKVNENMKHVEILNTA